MDAPKCKICGNRHWGVCYQPAPELKKTIAKVPAKRPAAAKKPAKPKAKPKAKKA